MDAERQAKLQAVDAAARRRSRTKELERAAQREQALTALKLQLERVARVERQMSDEDRRLRLPKQVSSGNRIQFNDTLYLLANAGEDTSGLYMPPGKSPAAQNGDQLSPDMIHASVVRQHIERALERFDPGFRAGREHTANTG